MYAIRSYYELTESVIMAEEELILAQQTLAEGNPQLQLKQDERGRLSVPNPDDRLTKPCYDARGFMEQFHWLDRMATSINDLGWDLYSLDHEDANGQFEFDFKYADALTSCDRFIFLRMMAKAYAKDEGLIATFMPKPFADSYNFV